MIVMPACSSGWFWHSLARETGRLGHLLSPQSQRGPWPWFPYALDNGAFSCWDPKTNTFDEDRWSVTERHWQHLVVWAQCVPQKPLWAIVPDVPGNAAATLNRWPEFAPTLRAAGIPLALAVQDGMMPSDAIALKPEVIFVGGSTEWKWATAESWCRAFPRVHVGRVNSPEKLRLLESWGCESCDGTGWNRGDRKQTAGLEEWCREKAIPTAERLWPHVCRSKNSKQMCFA